MRSEVNKFHQLLLRVLLSVLLFTPFPPTMLPFSPFCWVFSRLCQSRAGVLKSHNVCIMIPICRGNKYFVSLYLPDISSMRRDMWSVLFPWKQPVEFTALMRIETAANLWSSSAAEALSSPPPPFIVHLTNIHHGVGSASKWNYLGPRQVYPEQPQYVCSLDLHPL